MNLRAPGRADSLAAEYVLGTLRGRARQRFERLMDEDPVVAEHVRRWEDRLLPFAASLGPVAPPTRVWTAIKTRIRASGRARRASLWQSLGLWRAVALAGLAVVVALAVALLRPAPEGTLVVVLAGQDGKPMLVASANRGAHYLTVKALTPVTAAANRALELWALPEKDHPRSLGLVAAGGPVGVKRIALPAAAEQALLNIHALAVSVEPYQGSPTGLPTGPVIYTGPVQRLY